MRKRVRADVVVTAPVFPFSHAWLIVATWFPGAWLATTRSAQPPTSSETRPVTLARRPSILATGVRQNSFGGAKPVPARHGRAGRGQACGERGCRGRGEGHGGDDGARDETAHADSLPGLT
jgi:hypothetical protein